MKLYEFTAESRVTFFVVADNEGDAYHEARFAARSALDEADDIDTYCARDMELNAEAVRLHGGEEPYGALNPECQTVRELAEEAALNPPPNESVGPVHWCAHCLHERVQFDPREDEQLCRECREQRALSA